MNQIKDIQRLFFLGIGGIGMSALARYFKEKECTVAGYDLVRSELTGVLEKEGMEILYEEKVNAALEAAEIVVYTPAVPKENKLYEYALREGKTLLKRSEVLQMVLGDMKSIAVAGSHGKTTTTTMIAHILRASGAGSHAFLGGISANYGVNYWSSDRPLAVVEADEYDRSFLRLSPQVAVLTAMDADHLDIYGTVENLRDAFFDFTKKIKKDGLLIYHHKLSEYKDRFGDVAKVSYALEDDRATVRAENIRLTDGKYSFDIRFKNGKVFEQINLLIGGRYNIENAVAATVVCDHLGIKEEDIRQALHSFRGVKRRFEYVLKTAGKVYIDDYAHHPEELNGLVSSVKEQFPKDKLTVMFQPHLYSRTKDYAADFSKALSRADHVLLLPIYPAREKPLPGVTSRLIADGMEDQEKVEVVGKEEALSLVSSDTNRILVTAGAGDIGRMVKEIKEQLQTTTKLK